ncbi:hypothetical protein PC118_g3934 [Phytophthora cactorum]|uniref:Uncharacterized protein n=1 Tax=Phytophthora cactorum TaxID=29920 RepID=A0A8T1GFW4_9STRA|nr:hypothetical protein PC118_g3934 [Phytophthora cactorum]
MPAFDPFPGAAFPTRASARDASVHAISAKSPSESSTVDLASAEDLPRANTVGLPTPPSSTVVPTANVEAPAPDFAGVRASLDALRASVDYSEEIQHNIRTTRSYNKLTWLLVDARRLTRIASSLMPPTPRLRSYSSVITATISLRHRLEASQVALVDCKNALQERRENSREIKAVRLRHCNLQIQYNEAVEDFQNRIPGLEARLAAATSAGNVGAASPGASRRLIIMEACLAQPRSDRDKAVHHQTSPELLPVRVLYHLKEHRSRAGDRWEAFLQLVLEGMGRRLCDLDLLLDSFFLHFPQSWEAGVWYPGLSILPTSRKFWRLPTARIATAMSQLYTPRSGSASWTNRVLT